ETNPLSALQKLANATYETRAVVEQTDFGVRSKLLAAEIAAKKPDLIGLQEVALWRSGPLQLDLMNVAVPNAEHVDYDWLAMLRATASGSASSTPTSRRSAPTSPPRSSTSCSPGREATPARRSWSATATPTRSTRASRHPSATRCRTPRRTGW